MIRILLMDDHPVARHGITALIVDRVKDAVVGEAPDATSALRQVQDGAWNLVIADLSMPGMSGLELVKELRRIRPTLPTLVLSMHPSSQFARRALSAAAAATSAPTPPTCCCARVPRGKRRRTSRRRTASIRYCASSGPGRPSRTSAATSG